MSSATLPLRASRCANATLVFASARAANASGSLSGNGSAAHRIAALSMNGATARCLPSARAIRHSSIAPSASSPMASAPNSTSSDHSRSSPPWRESRVSTDSVSQFCSSLSSRSISLLWQAEDAVGDDAALDLLRPAVHGRGTRIEIGLVPELVAFQDVERGCGDALLGLGHEELHDRALRSDRPAAQELPDGAVRVVAQHLDRDERACELLPGRRVVEA